MRVLHVINNLDPSHGGPPAVVLRLAAAQVAAGLEPSILAYDVTGGQEAVRRSFEGIPGLDRVKLHLVPPGGLAERVFGRAGAAVLHGMKPACEFVHVHGVWDTLLHAAVSYAKRKRIPYALTPHGMLDPWSLGTTTVKAWKKRVAMALRTRAMLNGASFLHALNRDERDLFAPLRLRSPVEVIPNGVSLEEFASLPSRDEFGRKHVELGGRPYLVFLGRLHPKKGLDILLAAFERVSKERGDLCLVVAGPDGGARTRLLAQAEALGVSERLLVVGPVYGREKLAALVGASAFCLLSRQEGFSMAIIEALACGVPVVISTACHFPEVAEVGAGRIVSADVKEGASAILELLGLDRVRMGNAGRSLVKSRYTWSAVAGLLKSAYERSSARP